MKKKLIIILGLVIASFIIYKLTLKINLNINYTVGQKLDSLNHVIVYYNGGVSSNIGRNTTSDGYNLGNKYHCVEFVKRYYYQYLNHKMPDAYGNAKDFFDCDISDGQLNKKRNLIQYINGSFSKPQINDLMIFDGTFFNKYGHVAVISNVYDSEIEITQQNPGPFGKSRAIFKLNKINNLWIIDNKNILGWLRKN